MNTEQNFIDWFRGASPYIKAHRGRTLVIQVGGEALLGQGFGGLMQDIALLCSLGLRVVLVQGIRPQIEQHLVGMSATSQIVAGIRITDDTALQAATEAGGGVRVAVETQLSTALSRSSGLAPALRVISGNFVVARPLGVQDGVDYLHTGVTRRVDVDGIRAQLDAGNLVLQPPIGYSPSGQAFNMNSEELATDLAVELQADKLLFLNEQTLSDDDGRPVRQLRLPEARSLLARLGSNLPGQTTLRHAVHACTNGVKRCHLLNRQQDGTLLLELFTRDGVGSLVSAVPYDDTRRARIEDVGGIVALLTPLEEAGTLVRRPRELLEQEMEQFTVAVRDGAIIACAALYPLADSRYAELAALAVHGDYQGQGLGEGLLEALGRQALAQGRDRLVVLTTHTSHWFQERGFKATSPDDLPDDRKENYNRQRNSLVLVKALAR